MANYPSTNILIKNKYDYSLPELYLELDLIGTCWYHNNLSFEKRELHWFLGDSSVVILEYEKKANIKIISRDEIYLNHMKSKIERVLEETKFN